MMSPVEIVDKLEIKPVNKGPLGQYYSVPDHDWYKLQGQSFAPRSTEKFGPIEVGEIVYVQLDDSRVLRGRLNGSVGDERNGLVQVDAAMISSDPNAGNWQCFPAFNCNVGDLRRAPKESGNAA